MLVIKSMRSLTCISGHICILERVDYTTDFYIITLLNICRLAPKLLSTVKPCRYQMYSETEILYAVI